MKYILLTGMLVAIGCVLAITTNSKTKTDKMKIEKAQAAPVFKAKDVNENEIDLAAYKGKKILLSFHRFVGCPVCNLRFHQLEQAAPYLQSKGMVIINVYESTGDNLKKFTEGESFKSILIADPEERLYKMYSVERSGVKVMKGLFSGALGKVSEGKKMYKTKLEKDGHGDRIGADFIINEDGKIITAYYGKYLGDNLPVDSIKAILQ